MVTASGVIMMSGIDEKIMNAEKSIVTIQYQVFIFFICVGFKLSIKNEKSF